MSRMDEGAATPSLLRVLNGRTGLLFCAVSGLTLIAACAAVLSATLEAERSRAAGGPYETRPLEVLGALFVDPAAVVEAPTPADPPHVLTSVAASSKPKAAALRPRSRKLFPASIDRRRAELRVSDTTPRKGRGILITLSLPKGATATAPPELRLKDGKGAAYRSLMRPGGRSEEWVWASGLEVPGRWRGTVYAPCVDGNVTATLPSLTVLP